jgi:acyl dehydratase
MTQAEQALAWGEITDATVEHAEELIGTELRRDRNRWVSEATHDAIVHFAEGIGDRNPLYRDPAHGEAGPWGSMLAPPTFLYAVDNTVVAPRLAGVQWIYAGTAWTFYDVVRLGDGIDAKVTFDRQDVKGGEFASRWVLQSGRSQYLRRSDGALIAEARGQTARTPRGAALKKEKTKKYDAREAHRYTVDELGAIEREILAQGAGDVPRHWEDVEVGEELRPVVKGPLTSTDMIGWYAGAMGVRPYGGAHEDAVHYRTRHQDYHVSEVTGGKDSAGRGHLEAKTGDDVGMGGAYDIGPQRISWGAQLVTDWMGDAGFLHKLDASVRRPNLIGDTTWWKGTVTGTTVVDGYHLVDIDIHADNQRGETTARGSATVILPSREHGDVALPVPHDLTAGGAAA